MNKDTRQSGVTLRTGLAIWINLRTGFVFITVEIGFIANPDLQSGLTTGIAGAAGRSS